MKLGTRFWNENWKYSVNNIDFLTSLCFQLIVVGALHPLSENGDGLGHVRVLAHLLRHLVDGVHDRTVIAPEKLPNFRQGMIGQFPDQVLRHLARHDHLTHAPAALYRADQGDGNERTLAIIGIVLGVVAFGVTIIGLLAGIANVATNSY